MKTNWNIARRRARQKCFWMLCRLHQLLARERRPEVVPLRLLQQLDGACPDLPLDPPVRRPAPQTVHHNPMAAA
jgi:hypothetical protein